MSVSLWADIGINHNGSLGLALQLVKAAHDAGCDGVKFQKRTPRLAVPPSQWSRPRETPWGTMPYIEYKERLELSLEDYQEIDRYCRDLGIPWAASAWDVPSLEFIMQFDTPYIKVPSAKLTDWGLLWRIKATGLPVVLSTGMSTLEEIDQAVKILGAPTVLHCVSTYPAPVDELNLRCITMLKQRFPGLEVGYSGHEVGLATTIAAVAMGATWIERHITLDRSMWGTDQAASVEPSGMRRLVKDIHNIVRAMGDGLKKVEPGEREPMARLRG